MNCGNCGFWEPEYKIPNTIKVGRCMGYTARLKDDKCNKSMWAPRPTIEEVIENLEAKESRKA